MIQPHNKDDVLRMAKFLGDARYVVNYPSTIGLMEEAAAMLRAYAEVVEGWRPIETAPKDNKRPLYFAQFAEDGSLQSLDFDGAWLSDSKSCEIPEVYYYWVSAWGTVMEPTHWAYQDQPLPTLTSALSLKEAKDADAL